MSFPTRPFPSMFGVPAFLSTLVCVLALVLPTDFATAKTNPYEEPNNAWISISGKVKTVSPDAFTLDYGEGKVLVEMDDGDRDADAYKLIPGDEVTVYGRIDDDLYETTKIEAGSVYVDKLGTYFYASSVDEEDFYYTSMIIPPIPSNTVVHGVVTDVDGREFTLDTGPTRLTVETEEMAYDPLDDEGYQKLEPGDMVRVVGRLNDSFFEGREFVADSVTTIAR